MFKTMGVFGRLSSQILDAVLILIDYDADDPEAPRAPSLDMPIPNVKHENRNEGALCSMLTGIPSGVTS